MRSRKSSSLTASAEGGGEALLLGGAVRQRAEEGGVEQRVEHLRPARQHLGDARRGAHHQGDEAHQIGIAAQQREQARPRR